MGGIDEVKAGIASAADSANEAQTIIQSAVDKVNESISQLRESTSGSSNPKVDSSIGQLEQVVQALNEALNYSQGATDEANEYAAMI